MTDTIDTAVPEDTAWTEATGAQEGHPLAIYPEPVNNPHESPLSVNFSPDRAPQVTIRARTPEEWKALLEGVQASGVLGTIGEAWAALKAQAALGAGLGPTTPVAAPQAPAQGFQAPPAQQFQGNQPPPFGPNVSVPGAPAYQGPPAQQFAPAPPAQAWGAPQAGGGGTKAQPKACPPGWFRADRNSGPGGDVWKAWREANQQALKGKISWGGASTFWVAPDVAQMVHDQGFTVVSP